MSTNTEKLLSFLRDAALLRRKRVWDYTDRDRVLWISALPAGEKECQSPFHDAELRDNSWWLTVKKPTVPSFPTPPSITERWISGSSDRLKEYKAGAPELRPEISVIVQVPITENELESEASEAPVQSVVQTLTLADTPEVQEAWQQYIAAQWQPWAAEMRRIDGVRGAYESLDTMRRRLEEAAESFELVVAVGLLQWKDSVGKPVSRHLITAPAEIEFTAERGTISIVPSASFDSCRIELDMLEPQDQPRLENESIQNKLGEIGVNLWDQDSISNLMSEIANCKGSHSVVYGDSLERCGQITDEFSISFAPAVILRQRRLLAYDNLVKAFIEKARSVSPDKASSTEPWDALFGAAGVENIADEAVPPMKMDVDEVLRYLPLATNEEQIKILDRLEHSPCVVVKGPPGTGKSHTIANLMCHLLAKGERILVTAQAPKALSVLLDKLPGEIASLCVSALASSREEMDLLKRSVSGIMQRWNNREDLGDETAETDRLRLARVQTQEAVQKTQRIMREVREAESHGHELPGGFAGTSGEIARQLEHTQDELGWLPLRPALDHVFPLTETELLEVASINSQLTTDLLADLSLDLGSDKLPTPDEFENAVNEYRDAIKEHKAAIQKALTHTQADLEFKSLASTELDLIASELRELERCIAVAEPVLKKSGPNVLSDLLAGRCERYQQTLAAANARLDALKRSMDRVGDAEVEITGILPHEIAIDVERRLSHFRDGGRRGFFVFRPRVVRDTRHVERNCRVNGKSPTSVKTLEQLAGFCDSLTSLAKLREIWTLTVLNSAAPPAIQLLDYCESVEAVRQLVSCCEQSLVQLSASYPLEVKASLSDHETRLAFKDRLAAARCNRREATAKATILAWRQEALRSGGDRERHTSLALMETAINRCQPTEYSAAWSERQRQAVFRQRIDQYHKLLGKLDAVCPGVQHVISGWQGEDAQRHKILQLKRVFHWAAAKDWLRERTKATAWEEVSERLEVESEKLQRVTEDLASRLAWSTFFDRISRSPKILKDLEAWTQAQQSIGRGTGMYAFRHRQEAREYLNRCVSEMPAWIMPLHKVWENATATAGLFDTVIIDEASQAGVDSILLLLLAKRIIIVGDNMQNSPEGVGVKEDDLAMLVKTHLSDFPYGRRFRPDSSLFDHAKINFTNTVCLREHFRCAPEIIRFSNEHFYSDTPLIPLRQRPPISLSPLMSTFVEGGIAEGDGSRIRNVVEAEKLVDCIVTCLSDPQYEGKTMGVIALQGHGQAELIESMLRDRLDPQTIIDARLRCGDSAAFQGDERDVMFLSLVVAPNRNYTARTTLPDQRRYNVAMSRGRDQVWVFHSVSLSDLSHEDLRARLLRYVTTWSNETESQLSARLEQLERQAAGIRKRNEQPAPFDSWFEVDVALELYRRRYRVLPQFEVAGRPKYRIDLVIEGVEGRLAVECDGPCHLPPDQIERDLHRQRQLERAGWEFIRIPESEFYFDRTAAVMRIEARCRELGIFTLTDVATESLSELTNEAPTTEAVLAHADEYGELNFLEPVDHLQVGGPYAGYGVERDFPDPRSASSSNLRQVLSQIVEQDGPLSLASIVRLYREGCPSIGRAAKTVQVEIRKALGVMKRMKLVEVEDELEDGAQEGRIYRSFGTPRIRVRPAGQRRLEEIPPSELADVLLSSNLSSDEFERCCRCVLDHYGYQRLTTPRREYLRNVLKACGNILPARG